MLSILNVRSDTHNSCEDTVWVEENELGLYGGVFDGCSTGKNSHWASQTLAYLYAGVRSTYGILSDVATYMVLNKMRSIKKMGELTSDNFLSTAVLFQYNKTERKLSVRVFGDGVIYVNDVEHCFEQNNTPDYLGYQINATTSQEQYDYMDKYPVTVFHDVTKFQICSDGIKAITANQYEQTSRDPYALLLASPTSENYLKRMWNILHREKFSLGDDLSIVSYATT